MTEPIPSLPIAIATDVGQVAGMVKSGFDFLGDMLSRSDRDSIDKDAYELTLKLQNFFANNDFDSDDFRLFVDQLFNAAGTPLTPTGDAAFGWREFKHHSLLLAINHIKLTKYSGRAFAALAERGAK